MQKYFSAYNNRFKLVQISKTFGVIMSEALYMWMIGGFVVLMSIFTKVAYSDPTFYMEFLEKIISKLSFYLVLMTGSLWVGLYLSHNYAETKLNLSPEQSKLYSTAYNDFTNPLSMLYFSLCIAYAYSFFLIFVAEKKKKTTPQ